MYFSLSASTETSTTIFLGDNLPSRQFSWEASSPANLAPAPLLGTSFGAFILKASLSRFHRSLPTQFLQQIETITPVPLFYPIWTNLRCPQI